MGRLDNIAAALAQAGSDVATEHQQVMDAIAALQSTVVALGDQVAALVAGEVTDDEIAAVQASVDALDAGIKAIYEPTA